MTDRWLLRRNSEFSRDSEPRVPSAWCRPGPGVQLVTTEHYRVQTALTVSIPPILSSSKNLNEMNFCSSDKILQHLILTTAVRSGQKTQAVCWCPALSSLLQTLQRRRGVQHHRSSHPSMASAWPVAGSRHCHTQNLNIPLLSKGVMGLSR